jgi:FixJ family two-component response regulator
VLVLTGFPDLDLAVELMKKGVLDYLVKPVEKEKLIGAVDNATKQRKIF